jgi:hypothetical protein
MHAGGSAAGELALTIHNPRCGGEAFALTFYPFTALEMAGSTAALWQGHARDDKMLSQRGDHRKGGETVGMAARVDSTVARDLDQVQRIGTSRREGGRRLDKLERLRSAGATWRDVVGGKREVRYGERFLLVYEGGCEWLDRVVEVSCLFQVEFSCFLWVGCRFCV